MWDWLGDTGDFIADTGGDVGDFFGDTWNSVSGVTASREANNALQKKINEAKTQLGTQHETNLGYQSPYLKYGEMGASGIQGLLNGPGYQGVAPDIHSAEFNQGVRPGQYNAPREFQREAFSGVDDPGMAFAQKSAMDAAQKSAAARGMLGSSNTINKIQENAGDIANKYYSDAFNRNQAKNQQMFGQYADQRNFGKSVYDTDLTQYNTDVNAGLNRFGQAQGQYQSGFNDFLANRGQNMSLNQMLLNAGQSAANNSSQLGADYGNKIADLLTGQGSASAQARLGQYNTQKGAVSSGVDFLKDGAGLALKAMGG